MPDSQTNPESEELGVLLRAAMTSYHASLASALEGFQPMVRGYMILALVANNQKPSQLDIAQKLGVAKTVITYMLDDMEERGLVKRLPDPADRRRWRIALTRQGEEQFRAMEQNVRAAESSIFASMSPEEITAMKVALGKVAYSNFSDETIGSDTETK